MNPLINNEKHYSTLNNYLRARFGEKVFKVSLNAGFTCPNRDGTIGYGGCLYCSAALSGDFAGSKNDSLKKQFQKIKKVMSSKWPTASYIAYLQAGSNTYAPLEVLKKIYEEVINLDTNILVLSIATRPDIISDEVISLLKSINEQKEIWVELGFQTMHEETRRFLNVGYQNDTFIDTVNRLKEANLKVIVHIINGLPNESEDMMIETAKFLNQLPIDGIKIHMLHLMVDTPLGALYQEKPFPLLSLKEFVKITVNQLRHLNDNIIIHRLTGDAPRNLLIEPIWTLKKFVVINEIDKLMRQNNFFQGDLIKK